MLSAVNRLAPILAPNRVYRKVIGCERNHRSPLISIGGASPQNMHLGQEVNSRRLFNASTGHPCLEFVGGHKTARHFHALPFEEEREIIHVSSAAKDSAAALAVF